MKSKGFTLIELMVVVVIIGILAAIAIPNFMSMRQRAQEASVKSNMHTLQVSAENYSTMCQGVYPVAINTQVDVILGAMGFVVVDDHAISDVHPDGTGLTVNDGNPAPTALLPGNNTYRNPFLPADFSIHADAHQAVDPSAVVVPAYVPGAPAAAGDRGIVEWYPCGIIVPNTGNAACSAYIIVGGGADNWLAERLSSGQ
jgi:prepilin-type N-terminal cleavage/methylation domain-containing protein